MTRVFSLLMVVLVLGACAGQTTQPTYYLLRTDHDLSTRQMEPSERYVMGKVTIAPYIDQRGLLLETQEGDMHPARNHMWAEPLYEGARILLWTEVSRVIGKDILPSSTNTDAIRVNVRIDQLHGTREGTARLVAYWWLQDGNKVLSAYQYARDKPLPADGYAALARAEKELLADLASHIGESLTDPGPVSE